jgi:hypothetical protein
MGLEKSSAFWNSLPTWFTGLKVRILSLFVAHQLNVEQSKISAAGNGVQDKVRHHEVQSLVGEDWPVEGNRGDGQTAQRVSGQLQGRCGLEVVVVGMQRRGGPR